MLGTCTRNSPTRTIERLEPRTLLTSDFVISEMMAANEGGFEDGWGRSPDWIEIWNRGDEAGNLEGYTLSDGTPERSPWQFPEVNLAAGEVVLVFASGQDTGPILDPMGFLHTNFRLDRDGDQLIFGSPSGEILSRIGADDQPYPPQTANVAYGIRPQDSAPGFLPSPTPGEPNSSDSEWFADAVRDTKFSLHRGFYTDPVLVSLSTETSGASIRYTLDGTEPSLDNGLEYGEPIRLAQTTVVRAAAFRDGFLPTNVDTQSYFFPVDVFTQDGEGLPDTWGTFPFGSTEAVRGSPVPANYEMDPEVVQDPRYSDTLLSDLQSLPTVSLVLPPDALWNEESGIYANPTRSGVSWERAGSIELITPTGETEFQIDAGVRVHGGFGRRPSASAKHSFRLFFKGDYGAAKLEYPWFETGVEEFNTIVLRAHYNYSWSRGNRGGVQTGKDYTMVNDRWANLTQREMGGLSPDGTFVHLFLNGMYWGVYNPTERPDASFQASHRGGSREDYDVQNHEGLVDGNTDSWRSLLRLARTNPLDLEAVEQQLDVDNFIDYMLLNQFGGNGDWPQNNWYASRRRDDNDRWQFHIWDSEFFFVEPFRDRINDLPNSGPGQIMNQLVDSEEFRIRFADRIQSRMFHGGVLTPERNIARMDAIAAEIDRAIVGESARWGDGWMNQVDPARTRDDDWLPRLDELRTEYFVNRGDTVIRQYRRAGIFPETQAPTLSNVTTGARLGGQVLEGDEVHLSNPNEDGTIYYRLDGMDPRDVGGAVNTAAMPADQMALRLDVDTQLRARVLSSSGEWSPLIEADFTVQRIGDVDANGSLDAIDIDLICALLAESSFQEAADINRDGMLSLDDHTQLVESVMGTTVGDANLDGRFDSADLIEVFRAGLYESPLPVTAGWANGDWNCDGKFDSSDLVAAFRAGVYLAE